MFQDEDEKKHNWVPLDESVKCTMIWNMNKLPMLYIDDYTVLEELSDLKELRKGDHCLVPLNPIRKLLGSYFDAFVFLIGSLGILKLYAFGSFFTLTSRTSNNNNNTNNRYHHFIVMSDVDRLDDKGVPLDKNGRPVTYVLPLTPRRTHSLEYKQTHTGYASTATSSPQQLQKSFEMVF